MTPTIPAFLATIAITFAITIWASRRGASREQLYTAGGELGGGQNGLAIAGDFLSATTLLGTTALFYASGIDTAIYYLCPLVGLGMMLLLIAGPLRRLGRFTLGDVLATRLNAPRLRLFTGISSLIISLIYLIAQMVGAGALVSVLFNLSFTAAVVIVGALSTIYVGFGGMLAATWVQIVKAVLLIATIALLSGLVLTETGGFAALYERVRTIHPLGEGLFLPGGFKLDLFSTVSLSFGLILGMMGLPHLLIRLFTVPDEAAARRSVLVATSLIGAVFFLLLVVVGPGAVALVTGEPRYFDEAGKVLGGGNMVVLHLADALGGGMLFGMLAGVAFATILAVVAGLTVAAASSTAHDILGALRPSRPLSEAQEVLVFRGATAIASLVSVLLALAFQGVNVAFLAALAFAVAASTNFPVLVLTLYWDRTTARGAIVGGAVGLISSVLLILAGPAVWVGVLGHEAALFPSDYPTLITAPLAFLVAVLVSVTDRTGVARAGDSGTSQGAD